ncbi:ferrochelatase [Agaribacterium haliotis]|uniref:ferrochelatase n=1 Tax=Agaribacterium haliotis TaxID=2013869 RepID=UPI000BB540A0|nr:ferrochelatase [Agaribacterium haliotis]
MKFRTQAFQHGQARRIGVLISNLGSPTQPTAKALRPYLKQFLSDPRVIEVPRLLWFLILNLFILPFRPKKSAQAYREVWTEQGSPLALHTANQAAALQQRLSARSQQDIVVDWAMRYGEPSIGSACQRLLDSGVDHLLVLPLYPQYSASTTASSFDALSEDFRQRRWLPQLRFISGYHQQQAYIDALVQSIEQHWQQHGRQQKLIFSYHGLPLRYLHAGDPYHCFCLQTSRAVAERLALGEDEYLSCFQSRFGRETWLQPYTDFELKRLAKEGCESVSVICPGFAADCLETLEEIKVENRDYFLEAGGKEFHYIAALNSDDKHIDALAELCLDNLQGWISHDSTSSERYDQHLHNKIAK